MHKTIKYIIVGLITGIAVGGFFAFYAEAAFNEQINYQGKLTDSIGIAVPEGQYCMKFRIMDALENGNEVWSEEWKTGTSKVSVASGLFSILLGSHTSLSSVNFNNDSLYLEIQLDPDDPCDDNYQEVFSPRKRLAAVPAAFEAKKLGGYTWATPDAIGSSTPNTGAFTTLSASGAFTTSNGSILSSASGVLTLGGSGGTNNENLTLNFETAANTVTIGTGTGVTSLALGFGGLQLGANGASGQLTIYSEQGATDRSLIFQPHAAMSETSTYIWPVSRPDSNKILQSDLSGNLTWVTDQTGAGGGTPAGANYQIQYYDDGAFGASANFAYNKTNVALNMNQMRILANRGSSGSENLFLGQSGNFTMTGTKNILAGYQAGLALTTGYGNQFIGYQAGRYTTTGSNDVFLGEQAGYTNVSGNANVFLGYQAGYYETGSNKLFIDNQKRASEADAKLKALVYGVFNASTTSQILAVNAKLGILDSGSDHYTYFQGGNQSADVTYTLPTSYPAVSGYVLSSTTGGTLSWAAAGGGTIDGSGAATRVAYWSDADTLTSNASFTFDGSILSAPAVSTDSSGKGITMSGSNGVLTVGGTGNINNENLTINFESISNQVSFGTGTGVTSLALGFGGLQLGANGASGQLTIYSEQGATDRSLIFQPHAAMTETSTYIWPVSKPASNKILQSDLSGNLTWVTDQTGEGGGTPAGANYQIQYYNNGAFGANINFAYDTTNVALNMNQMRILANRGSSGSENLFLGQSGNFSMTGTKNILAGYQAGQALTTGYGNNFIGYQAGYSTTTGSNDVFLGEQAGYSNISGNANVFLGYQAGYYETGSNKLFIDNQKRTNESDARIKALIYGVFDSATANQSLAINGSFKILEGGASAQYYTTFTGGDQAGNVNYTLPTSYPAVSGYVLSSTTGGTLSWAASGAGGMVYPDAGIALSTGSAWGTSITNNSANWNTAFGWGNHASAGYLTSVTAHNLLSTTHGDTTAASAVRGDIITGQGASPVWARLAKGSANSFLRSDGTDVAWSAGLLSIASGKTLTVNNTLTLAGTDATTMTFPTTSATIARTDAAQTFTGVQTMTSPSIATSITTASTSFTAFAGATTLLTIGGTGASASLFVPSTLDTTSSITGAIRTSGGISAAKAGNIGTTLTVGTNIELGHASDTTIARVSAGVVSVEGKNIYLAGGTDVAVADGGTGLSSMTAYALLAGGTTTTGALQQVSGLGDAGQVLTSGGAGTLPTWAAATGTPAGANYQIQYYNNGAFGANINFAYDTTNVALNMNAMRILANRGSSGSENLFLGQSGNFTMTGTKNILAGYQAGQALTTGYGNQFIGYQTGYSTTTGSNDVFLGEQAGYSNISGNANVFLGYQAGYYETGSNKLFIDNRKRTDETDARTKSLIYGIFADAVANQYLTVNGNTDFSAGLTTLKYGTSAPTFTTNGQIAVTYEGSAPRIRFRANGVTYYIDKTGGFGIPGPETIDPISGDKMKIGDFVVGMINQNLEDEGNLEESSLHGIWVKWDSLKAELIQEIRANGGIASSGGWASNTFSTVEGVDTTSMLDRVKNTLFSLGITIKDGITYVKELVARKITTDVVQIKKMEIIDEETGDIYCIWLKGGNWQKAKGDCDSIKITQAVVQTQQLQASAEEIKQEIKKETQKVKEEAKEEAKDGVKQESKEEVKKEIETEISPISEKERDESSKEKSTKEKPTLWEDLIKDATAKLLYGALEFIKWIFSLFLKK